MRKPVRPVLHMSRGIEQDNIQSFMGILLLCETMLIRLSLTTFAQIQNSKFLCISDHLQIQIICKFILLLKMADIQSKEAKRDQ